MATSMSQISTLLNNLGLKFVFDEKQDVIMTGFGTQVYRDRSNDQGVMLVISLHDDGQYLRISAPYCFAVMDREYLRAAQAACSAANFQFRLGRFVVDPNDGEVSLVVEDAVLDTQLTQQQLASLLGLFPSVLDMFDDLIRTAVETGEVIDPEDPAEVMRAFQEFMQSRRQRRPVFAMGLGEMRIGVA